MILIDYSKPDSAMRKILNLPLEQQDQYIAEWMMAVIGDYRIRPLPTPPDSVKDYQKMNQEMRSKMNAAPQEYKNFWDRPEVKKHFDDVDRVNNYNFRNKNALLWLKEYFINDYTKLEQINSLLNDYVSDMDKVVEQPHWSD